MTVEGQAILSMLLYVLMICIMLSIGVLMLMMIIWKLADVVRNKHFCINFVHDNST